jgi:hypothetical protein
MAAPPLLICACPVQPARVRGAPDLRWVLRLSFETGDACFFDSPLDRILDRCPAHHGAEVHGDSMAISDACEAPPDELPDGETVAVGGGRQRELRATIVPWDRQCDGAVRFDAPQPAPRPLACKGPRLPSRPRSLASIPRLASLDPRLDIRKILNSGGKLSEHRHAASRRRLVARLRVSDDAPEGQPLFEIRSRLHTKFRAPSRCGGTTHAP